MWNLKRSDSKSTATQFRVPVVVKRVGLYQRTPVNIGEPSANVENFYSEKVHIFMGRKHEES